MPYCSNFPMAANNFDHIVCLLPRKDFDIESIQNYFLPSKQNIRKGRDLVACGFVRGIARAPRSTKTVLYAYVQAEKKAHLYYKTKLKVENGKWRTVCTCQARNEVTRCKHQAAFLFALICLRDSRECICFPKYFERKGIARLRVNEGSEDESALEWKSSLLYGESEIELTWSSVINYMIYL